MKLTNNSFDTPILLLLFNRPHSTKKVFGQIQKIKPSVLFIAADGPRLHHAKERELCEQTRALVLKGITWPCKVHTLFRDVNEGCGIAVSNAITWFFTQVEYGIILEDDTVPHLSFFTYCQTLLHKYQHNEKVMHISGNTFHSFSNKPATSDSYYFSSFPFVWGWATWKRAWMQYDFAIIKNTTAQERLDWMKQHFSNEDITNYWTQIFAKVEKEADSFTWDYQWSLSIWKNKGISILPTRNLVTNIGWNKEATHTKDNASPLGEMKYFKINSPLISPTQIKVNDALNNKNFTNYYQYWLNKKPSTITALLKRIAKKIFGY